MVGAFDETSHFQIFVGTNFVSVSIREHIIFGFLSLKSFRLFVSPRDSECHYAEIGSLRRYLSLFARIKNHEVYLYENEKLIIFQGEITYFDPARKNWVKCLGKLSIIEF